MFDFELAPLDSVNVDELHRVLSNPRISRHLPLFDPNIDIDWVKNWVKSKISQWDDPRLGPYAVLVAGKVVGWAGYQPDGDCAELAIVLEPDAWGIGKEVIESVSQRWQEFGDNRKRVFYLPTTRNLQSISTRFEVDYVGEFEISGHKFAIFAFRGQG